MKVNHYYAYLSKEINNAIYFKECLFPLKRCFNACVKYTKQSQGILNYPNDHIEDVLKIKL